MFAIETTSTAAGFVSTAFDEECQVDYVTYPSGSRKDAETDALGERIEVLRATREVFQEAPDMNTASLSEPWHGTVLIDTTVMPSSTPRARRK